MAAFQKRVLSSALALGVSRWSRTGRAGPGCPWRRLGTVEGAGLKKQCQHLNRGEDLLLSFIDCN